MTKRNRSRMAGIALAAIMSVSAVGAPILAQNKGFDSYNIVSSITAEAAGGRKFNQNENQWKNGYYRYGRGGDTLYNAGCGIFALGNAVWALNGNTVDIRGVASWAAGNGSWRPGSGGLIRSTFYSKVGPAYGGKYGFSVSNQTFGGVGSAALINHLQKGGVAVVHVPNHFIAITGYNANNRTYHVIESAVYSGRGLQGDSWVSANKLSNGSTKVDWFCLISNTSKPNTGGNCFPRYSGGSSSIVVGLTAVGANSSFSYRTNIYNKNGLSILFGAYRGTAVQNTAMLNLLKKGKLRKP